MIEISSPTRFDLAGGTLDMWPIWAMLGGACTINVAINIHTHCTLQPRDDERIIIESPDLNKKWEFNNLEELILSPEPQLSFYKAHIGFWQPEYGFRLKTSSESPVGGGLGGSSSLSVAIFKAFLKWQHNSEMKVHDLVRSCSNIEAEVLQTPTGTQDYYPAALGGLNIIDYYHEGPHVQVYENHKGKIDSHFFIVYTGKSHNSGINNWQVLKNFIDGDVQTKKALFAIRDVAFMMKDACLNQKWQDMPILFEKEYQARMLLADSFSSPEIEKLKSLSVKYGAKGLKICGAGGGGCVLIWCDPELRQNISDKIKADGFQILETQLA